MDKLKILLEVSKQLSSPNEFDKLLEKILELLFKIMNVDRAIILMVNQETGQLEQKAVRVRAGISADHQFYSKQIITSVRRNGDAILTADARIDKRFNKSESIVQFRAGILGWVLGDHSRETFKPLWVMVGAWRCYFGSHRRWERVPRIYPTRRPNCEQNCRPSLNAFKLESGGFAYITRVEGENPENPRLRHYLARLHRKTLCDSKSEEMLRPFNSLATALPEILRCAYSCLIHAIVQQRQKLHKLSRTPKKKPRGGKLTRADKQRNRELAKVRVIGEHVHRKLKVFRILSKRYRNRRKRFGLRFNLVAGLYNYELRLAKTVSV